ncbi:MAG: DUF1553 domain-containing protein, partial [Planctomycetes bacterium]|nr:DUF1553 domain-containing protein [Planctomycetota bacterium]
LHVTGALRSRMGGPGYSAFKPNSNYVRNYIPRDQWGPAQWRRMIYMTKVRMEQDAVFGVLDCPDAGQVTAKRSRSTTPLQALNLLNSRFMLQQAELLAKRISRTARKNRESPIRIAFRTVLGREPSANEIQAAAPLVTTHGLRALCRALLNSNEFLFLQ